MPSHRGRRTAVVAVLLLAVAFSNVQAAPPSGGRAAAARQAAGARLVADAAGRLAAWLSVRLAALLVPGRPGGGAGPWPPQVTCDAGSQMDPNGKCVAVPTGP